MRGWVLGLAMVGLLAVPSQAQDLSQSQDLAAMNRATVQALGAGDLPRALTLGQAALDQPGPVTDRIAALNAMGYILLLQGQDATSEALLAQAMTLAEAAGKAEDVSWFLALQNRIALAQRQGRPADAMIDRFVAAGRRAPWAADILGAAADMLFRAARYDDMTATLRDMVALGQGVRSATTLDTLFATQNQAEAEGRIVDASALIDARIVLVQALQPALAAEFAHTALWRKFYLSYQAGDLGPAADALRAWAATGTMSADERSFLATQARDQVLYAELSSYGTGRVAQLGQAQLALAFDDVAPTRDPQRRARALRALALAQGGLGQHETAAATLHAALALTETATLPDLRLAVLEDLAANAWARGDAAAAQQIYQTAEAGQQAAGLTPLDPIDQVIGLQNRARVAIDLKDTARARALMDRAWALYRADQAQGAQKSNVRALEVSLWLTEAGFGAPQTQGAEPARRAVALADRLLPPGHPDLAALLAQAADALATSGALGEAAGLLARADAINAATLPADAPAVVEVKQSRAALALLGDDRDLAVRMLTAAAAGRKSPDQRANLAAGGATFDMLVWALLDRPDPDLALAFDALQWTQITGSAAALAALQQRLSATSPLRASLIARTQDLTLQSHRLRSDLTAAYAQGLDPAPLRQREAPLAAALAAADAALAAEGLEMTGLASVVPVPLADIQALLAPDEALVTFVLPGLRPSVVPGLQGSSNFALAVTRDAVHLARIPDPGRGSLNDRITVFRCQIALNEPGCTRGAAGAQRGAMSLTTADEPDTGFDPAPAQALYADLFAGLEPALQGKTHLIVIPPPDLLRLPFQALVTGPVTDRVPWLIRRHALSVLPSIPSFATLRRAPAPPAPRRFLGLGDPILAPAAPVDCTAAGLPTTPRAGPPPGLTTLALLPSLPDATCELRAIAAGFAPDKARVLTQAQATETAIKALDQSGELARQDLLVFATHGLLAGEAGAVEPALVMTPPVLHSPQDDGLLTASEIASLRLGAALVILSACNTAAGDGPGRDGLSGLARAFFQAGARQLLVTHWSVYSQAATQVSTGFAAHARAHPLERPSSSLRAVLLTLLDQPDPRLQDPSFWAAFTLIGAD